jgi:hypothetical protein
MADCAKSISGRYNEIMKIGADLQRAGATGADGVERENGTFGSTPSASSADLLCLPLKWTICSRTGAI